MTGSRDFRPRLRNSRGRAVDPVPFIVVSGLAFMILFSFGPLYGLAFGVSVSWGLVTSAVIFVGVTAIAYHRLVWRARPELSGEIPASLRAQWLFYLMVALAILIAGLAIPLLV